MTSRWVKNCDDGECVEHLLMDQSIQLRSFVVGNGILNGTTQLTLSGTNPIITNTVVLLSLVVSGGRWDVSFMGGVNCYPGGLGSWMDFTFMFVLDGALRVWTPELFFDNHGSQKLHFAMRSIVQAQPKGSVLTLRVGWQGGPSEEYQSSLCVGSVFSALRVGNYR